MPPIRRREVFRPSRATADRAASARGTPQESAGAGGAPTLQPHLGSALTECAGRRHSPRTDLQTRTTTATPRLRIRRGHAIHLPITLCAFVVF